MYIILLKPYYYLNQLSSINALRFQVTAFRPWIFLILAYLTIDFLKSTKFLLSLLYM